MFLDTPVPPATCVHIKDNVIKTIKSKKRNTVRMEMEFKPYTSTFLGLFDIANWKSSLQKTIEPI